MSTASLSPSQFLDYVQTEPDDHDEHDYHDSPEELRARGFGQDGPLGPRPNRRSVMLSDYHAAQEAHNVTRERVTKGYGTETREYNEAKSPLNLRHFMGQYA